MSQRDEKIMSLISRLAADYINREATPASLITLTKVVLSAKGSRAMLFVSVLPDSKQDAALDFLKRKRNDIRQYVMVHAKMGRIPFMDVAIDKGEKNRQIIEDLSQSI